MVLPMVLCEPTTLPLLGADASGQSVPIYAYIIKSYKIRIQTKQHAAT